MLKYYLELFGCLRARGVDSNAQAELLLVFHLQDLKSVNRSVTPWVIVHGHRPAYATVVDTGSVIQAQDQRNAFEDIFVQYGVSTCRSCHCDAEQATWHLVQVCKLQDPVGTLTRHHTVQLLQSTCSLVTACYFGVSPMVF